MAGIDGTEIGQLEGTVPTGDSIEIDGEKKRETWSETISWLGDIKITKRVINGKMRYSINPYAGFGKISLESDRPGEALENRGQHAREQAPSSENSFSFGKSFWQRAQLSETWWRGSRASSPGVFYCFTRTLPSPSFSCIANGIFPWTRDNPCCSFSTRDIQTNDSTMPGRYFWPSPYGVFRALFDRLLKRHYP